MNSSARHHAVLHRLALEGSVAESSCGPSLRKVLGPLLRGGILARQKSGAGQRIAVINQSRFVAFLAREFPHEQAAVSKMPVRVQGVARFRDTKTVRGASDEIVCVRGWHDGALLRNGDPVAVAQPTRDHGVFAFLLMGNSAYQLRGAVATVENPTLFAHFDRLHAGFDLVLYTSGRLSRRLIAWLALQAASGLKLVHFGDYDPAGLDDYRRLRTACGEAVTLHCPEGLPRLFRTYGNSRLLDGANTQALLKRLRTSQDPTITSIVTLIDESNAGLEQEALLLGGNDGDNSTQIPRKSPGEAA